jgi:hypothetical protein
MDKFKQCITFIILFYSVASWAEEFPYITKGLFDIVVKNSEFLVKNISPVKDQGNVGICYGESSALILEQFRCESLKLDCLNSENIINSFDVASYSFEKGTGALAREVDTLQESGYLFDLLKNIESSNHLIAKESCAPFSSITKHKLVSIWGQETDLAKAGWNYLISKWKEYKNQIKEKSKSIDIDLAYCLAKEVKEAMPMMVANQKQLADAFTTSWNLSNFIYKSLLPIECLDPKNMLTIPSFKVESFPTKDDHENKSVTALEKKIEELIHANIPVVIQICIAQKDDYYNCLPRLSSKLNYAHSTTIVGIKEICTISNTNCRKMVKIQNSLGEKWQNDHDDGWVELSSIAFAAKKRSTSDNITWIVPN